MKRGQNGHITAFYFETLLLITVFIAIILVLTQVFGLAQTQSAKARRLTDAVALAGNAAEAVSASTTEEELVQLLNDNDNAEHLPDGGVCVFYGNNLDPKPDGIYRVEISWAPDPGSAGTMVHSEIQVWFGDAEEPVYRLETQSFHQGVSA